MKRMMFASFYLLVFIFFSSSLGWAGATEDIKAGYENRLSENYDEAIRLYTKAIESGELSEWKLGEVYVYRGDIWAMKNDYDKAIADYTKAIELNPMSNIPNRLRGDTRGKKEEYDRAIADYTKAIELFYRDFQSYLGRGLIWVKKGDYDKAIADYTKAIELHPRYTDAYYNRGEAWEKKGDYNKAITDYNKVTILLPDTPIASKAKEVISKLEKKIGRTYSVPQQKVAQGGAVSVKGTDGRFIAYDNGTVLDTKTGLMWAAWDNGGDIIWQNAKGYCEHYRGGGYTNWRMPTMDELASLYDESKPRVARCGVNYTISVATELIDISCDSPWASENEGSGAAYFGFHSGKRKWGPKSESWGGRALPVRNAR